jgi:hypothetical protein
MRKVKIDFELACFVATYGSDKNYNVLIRTAPRKLKKKLKKELIKAIISVFENKADEIMEAVKSTE